MDVVIGIGAALTLAGLVGVVGCIVAAFRARRAGHDDATMRAVLQRIVIWNMAALGFSMLGLMVVVVGIVLKG